ncbi:MAG: hypothetical protein KJ901_22525 [Gammaproteobacteria bacterium]|nr:hypothetical protein [Gammaproteobacteria bacterium]
MQFAKLRCAATVVVGLWATLIGCTSAQAAPPRCERTIRAEVVAIEQAVVLNRYGAFNPAGMLYALRRDVVFTGHPAIADGTPVTEANLAEAPGKVRLRSDKRPRPIVLRANEGDCLEVRFHNLLMRNAPDELKGSPEQYDGKVPAHAAEAPGTVYNQTAAAPSGRNLVRAERVSNDRPWTRAASFHVNGLDLVPTAPADCPVSTEQRAWLCGTEGDNVGMNVASVHPATPQPLKAALQQQGGQVLPGQSAIYRMYAFREGTYFAYSTAASVGGEGDGGQIGAGLFGAVNVQPRDAKWYRSQVTRRDLEIAARAPVGGAAHPFGNLDYDGARYAGGPLAGRPVLAMLDAVGPNTFELVHTDLNAIVALRGPGPDHHDTTSGNRPCTNYVFGNACGQAYREFTVVMHDEVKAVQAFAELEDETNPLHAIKDGMGINYGVGGMGAMVVARNRRTGPTKDCPECRAEEFFLSSWANGDPALVLKWDAQGNKPIGAMYPDDPSNVHHSYLNDPVRFRNLHAGPKETHVFHLHAHQWVQDASAPGSTYLDSQTISPGATFSYEIEFGGSGNLNLAPGDSIFHCHLYPHFAQGMWELWRVHDVFEDGSDGRKLPDAEEPGGTENPAVVPLPGSVLALLPTDRFAGYPFYIPGEAGHRPPQPPKDMDKLGPDDYADGGLQRHVLTGWEAKGNRTERALSNQAVLEAALSKGSTTAQINARRVYRQNPNALTALAEEWSELGGVKLLDPEGVPSERDAMAFHAGTMSDAGISPRQIAVQDVRNPEWKQERKGYVSERANRVAGQPAAPPGPPIFHVNGRAPMPGAPYADPCPADAPKREYRAGVIQTELTVNRHGWFDPQARILALENDIANIIDPATRDRLPEPLFFRANSGDCITFKHSNFVPSALALDDFQIYTPTDTIGQHIHLVKFDVTSSDGSGNGWNYEDGTFSPEEVRERVHAYNVAAAKTGKTPLQLKTHPLFTQPCAAGDDRCRALQARGQCPPNAAALPLETLARDFPFCGAQRTVQRWYADPIFDAKNGKDYTLRTVFTHDHFSPSSHQQHGLYAALVIEPTNSVWLNADSKTLDWNALCSADPAARQAERAKVLGGANLGNRFDDQCASRDAAVAADETRPPLKLREDGGPTSTRANIVAPKCLHGIGGGTPGERNRGTRKNTNPIDPQNAGRDIDCAGDALQAHDTRREYALAFADFSVLYNNALEPINPETRDLSALRFGRRQTAINRAAPLAISSEDPGSQLINYRNEPVPLRVTEFPPKPNAELGGFDYSQQACSDGDLSCTGDMANLFSTAAHAARDRDIATRDWRPTVSPQTRELLAGTPVAGKLDDSLAAIERWRKDFNCALYGPDAGLAPCRIATREPWRVMGDPATPILAGYEGDPMYVRLIQGAQEAQHVFAMTGNKWLREPDNPRSGYANAQPLGISEHFEFNLKLNPIATRRYDSLYLGSSMDQLWDGMWGLVRSYGMAPRPRSAGDTGSTTPVAVTQPGLARLNGLPGDPVPMPPPPVFGSRDLQVCAPGIGPDGDTPASSAYARRLFFDISVVRACELTGTCDVPGRRGIPYNDRLRMDDPNGIVFVRNNHLPGEPEPTGMNLLAHRQILDTLREQVKQKKRRIEPLVLRAAAGQCMQVLVRNHLPPTMDEGPTSKNPDAFSRYRDNFMSMITDGFNYNQLRMSTSVGLSAPKVASYGPLGDGANIGVNTLERSRAAADESAGADASTSSAARRPTPRGAPRPQEGVPAASSTPAQGGLVPPCREGDPENRCTSNLMMWYAGNYELDGRGVQRDRPVEFGALPLSSFGDVIKHPAHGAIGALVIGPPGSRVCPASNASERAADEATYTSVSLCDAANRPLYRDFVVVLQDAVDAQINGDPVPNLKGAEEPDDYGIKAVNYRTEPIWARRGGDPSLEFEERNEFDHAGVLSSKPRGSGCQAGIEPLVRIGREKCDPETPVFTAQAGREVRLRVVHPGGHTRQQAFALHGHDWTPHPFDEGSRRLLPTHAAAVRNAWTVQGAYNGIGPLMGADLLVEAGGRWNVDMDYLWRSQAAFVFDGGIWGLMRVVKP